MIHKFSATCVILALIIIKNLRNMTKLIPFYTAIVFVAFIPQKTISAQQISPNPPKLVILLNNDRVVQGEILSSGETVQVRNELGLITILRSDIATIATTLREVYQFKKENTLEISDSFLKLADWCVANHLVDEAAVEFDRAILLAGHPQQVEAIRNRKNAALSMLSERHSQVDLVEQENQKYRQWKEKIPASTFTTFKREILPLLVQNCNGIACHSSNSLNEFRFVANPNNRDVDVAKNLQIVLGYVTPGLPEESPLVLIPIAPHGRTKQIFTRQNLAKYQKLYFWTEQVAKEMDAYFPLDEADRKRQPPVPRPETEKRTEAMTIQPASGGNLPFPLPGESLVDNTQPDNAQSGNAQIGNTQTDNTSGQNQPSSLAQGLTARSLSHHAGASGLPRQQHAAFDFFRQPSIVVPGSSPGGWQGHAVPGLHDNRETNVMTHDSTASFEQNSLLRQMQRAPVDPFDPVQFNRQYHFRRVQDGTLRQ